MLRKRYVPNLTAIEPYSLATPAVYQSVLQPATILLPYRKHKCWKGVKLPKKVMLQNCYSKCRQVL